MIMSIESDLPIVTIGLFWHSPNSDNLGVGALTVSNISIIREVCKKIRVIPFFKVFGFLNNRDVYVSGVDIEVIALSGKRVFSPISDLGYQISKCDVIFDIGGGDSFTDIYGVKRFLYLTVTKIRAVRNKIPLVYSPQTIGPFRGWFSRWLAGRITRKANLVFARDQLSYSYAADVLRVDASALSLTTDVAFALPFTREGEGEGEGHTLKVGINVSGLLFNGGYKGKNELGLTVDYPAFVRDVIDFSVREGCEVYLFPHVISKQYPIEDDYSVCQKLAKEFDGVGLMPPFLNPMDAKTAISKMDIFTGARMHACIAAFSSGVPVIPIAYSRKFEGLFQSLGYSHTIDCLNVSSEDAFVSYRNSFEDREQLKQEVGLGNCKAVESLNVYKEKIGSFLREICDGR